MNDKKSTLRLAEIGFLVPTTPPTPSEVRYLKSNKKSYGSDTAIDTAQMLG